VRLLAKGRGRLIAGIIAGAIIFSLPVFPFLLESAGDQDTFPEDVGDVTLVRESKGLSLLNRLHVPLPTDQVEDVQMGTYVDTFGRSASIMLIRYPDHDTAFNRLESLKTKGVTQTEIMPLTAPTVYSIPGGNSVQYFYVKKSTLYVVELNGVEFGTLTSAIINI
jgi:hypothetical protein